MAAGDEHGADAGVQIGDRNGGIRDPAGVIVDPRLAIVDPRLAIVDPSLAIVGTFSPVCGGPGSETNGGQLLDVLDRAGLHPYVR